MRTRIVLKGKNELEAPVLLGLELKVDENTIIIATVPDSAVTDAFQDLLMKKWRNGEELEFPEGTTFAERPLSMSESLLPDGYEVARPDILLRAQTEWHFVVLSSKLHISYKEELGDIKEKIEQMTTYQRHSWDDLKNFWSKVQGQIREKNLFGDHIKDLRGETDELFTKLKSMRSSMDDEISQQSKVHYDTFIGKLSGIEANISEGLRLSRVMDDLKKLQAQMKDVKLTREHRNTLWNKLDKAFKETKLKRFGGKESENSSASARLQRRYDGLMSAIDKMSRSIKRDKSDLSFQDRRIELSEGQLETELRKAKVMMIEERVRSKDEKLADMLKTKLEIEKRIEKEKAREEKRLQQKEVEKKKAELAKKVQQDILAAQQNRENGDVAKLEKVAETLNESRKPKAKPSKPTTEGIFESLSVVAGDFIEDAIDTAKAVAMVLEDKVEHAIDEIKEEFTKSSEEE